MLLVRVALLGAIAGGVVLEYGFYQPPLPTGFIHLAQAVLFAVYGADLWVGVKWGRLAIRHIKMDWVDALLIGVGAAGVIGRVGGLFPVRSGWLMFEFAAGGLLVMELWRLNVGLSRRLRRPGALLPISFLTLVVVGTVLLKAPQTVPAGQHLSWLDALFTMTSAVCVTGLVVRDTATQFTPFGQALIGVFIQLGGLGIIVFGSMLAMLLGHRLPLQENLSLSATLNDQPLSRVVSLVRFVVITTLLFELAGALALGWLSPGDAPFRAWIGPCLFHAVSAFCNAGFSLYSNSLEPYRYGPQAHGVILPLLVIGGLGFPVLENLWQAARWRLKQIGGVGLHRMETSAHNHPSRGRLSLHTKVVLATTAGLYLYGVVGIGIAQLKPYTHAYFQQGVTANRTPLPPLSAGQIGATLADASFMSLSSRTAGFNTVPMEQLQPAGRFVVMTLMMIGASPGGTGGGMKTTTATLLLLTVVATVRRRGHTEVFSRQISDQLVRKAATLAACFVALATGATLLLTLSEPYPFEKLAFEAISAASTTGLSLGITGDLTGFGKAVIIATMFLGRVGPLALLGMLVFRASTPRPYAYPHEEVVMG